MIRRIASSTIAPLLVCSLLAASLPAAESPAAESPAPSGRRIVPKSAKLELLYTRTADIEGGLTEGPAVAPDGSIYFSDIPLGDDKGLILRYDPKSGKTEVFAKDSGKSNGLIFAADGSLLAAEGADQGGRQIARWNVKTGEKTTVADRFEGKRFNAPNDLCVDAEGRIYFSDPRYLGDEPRELEHRAVYRIDADGSVHLASKELTKPNGVAVSPNGRLLYVANHDNGTDKIDPTKPAPEQGIMTIYAYRLNRKGEVIGERKTLVDFEEKKGCDGMCVDASGNLYLTVRDAGRPGVMVVNRRGKEIAFIPTGPENQKIDMENPPVGLPSNVEFGIGDDADMLYVTVDKSLYRIRLKAKGFHAQYGDEPAMKKKKDAK
ncbi:MAG: SMP-30/gluconolactonase/LRE family protein [Pirellulaceae bacterium]